MTRPDATPSILAGVSASAILLVAAGFFAGGVSVGAVGFGSVLIAAPLVAVVEPGLIPFVFTVPVLVADSFVAWRERSALDRGLLGRLLVAQVPGALLGAWLLGRVARDELLGLVVGLGILVMVGVQMTRWRIRRTPRRELAAASLAGASGALSGVNGPPVAVLLADESPSLIRATLPAFFVGAQLVLLASWTVTGTLQLRPLAAGVVAAPAMHAGAVVGQRLAARITARGVRWSVLILSLLAVARSLAALTGPS
jgi:uncharacterized membrane protein YfcA